MTFFNLKPISTDNVWGYEQLGLRRYPEHSEGDLMNCPFYKEEIQDGVIKDKHCKGMLRAGSRIAQPVTVSQQTQPHLIQ